jgi:hypothetical protein
MRTAKKLLEVGALALVAGLLVPATADAAGPAVAAAAAAGKDTSNRSCIEAYERVQTLRDQGALGDARAAAIACSADSCPKVLAKECATWLDQIAQSQPTVVLGATAPDGKDLTNVRVTVDGKSLATELGARALPIDPGAHKLRFESDEHGAIELDVVVREGEKNRRIVAAFMPKPEATPPRDPTAPSRSDEGLPLGFWIVGGLGVAGVGVGATFEVLGLLQAGELDACKPSCDRSEVDAMSMKLLVGDIAVGAGATALVGALIIALTDSDAGRDPEPDAEAATVSFAPAIGPGFLGVVGAF